MILFIITFNKNSYYIILLFLRLETLNNEHSNEITEKSKCSKKRKIDYKDDDEVIKKSKIIHEDTSNKEWLNVIII